MAAKDVLNQLAEDKRAEDLLAALEASQGYTYDTTSMPKVYPDFRGPYDSAIGSLLNKGKYVPTERDYLTGDKIAMDTGGDLYPAAKYASGPFTSITGKEVSGGYPFDMPSGVPSGKQIGGYSEMPIEEQLEPFKAKLNLENAGEMLAASNVQDNEPTPDDIKRVFELSQANNSKLVNKILASITAVDDEELRLRKQLEDLSKKGATNDQLLGAAVAGLGHSLAYGLNKNFDMNSKTVDNFLKPFEDQKKEQMAATKELLDQLLKDRHHKDEFKLKLMDAANKPDEFARVAYQEQIRAYYRNKYGSNSDEVKEKKRLEQTDIAASAVATQIRRFKSKWKYDDAKWNEFIASEEGKEFIDSAIETMVTSGKHLTIGERGVFGGLPGVVESKDKFILPHRNNVDLEIVMQTAKQKLGTEPGILTDIEKAANSYAGMTDKDRVAVEWAKENRGNPSAEKILRINGIIK